MDKLKQTTEDRIKAYIYFGVEAEMEIVELQDRYNRERDDADYKDDLRIAIAVAGDKIALANKRIAELENPRHPL